MNMYCLTAIITLFALQVQCAPQINLAVNVNGVTESAWINNVLGSAANTIDAIAGVTTPPSLPQRVQQVVQGAAASLSNSIRNAPATIQGAFQSASQSFSNFFAPRTTTQSSLFPSLSINLNNKV